MISEIHHKAPRDYIGKEDVLTGHFFGALRYTKFQDYLGKCLVSKVKTSDLELIIQLNLVLNDYFNNNIHFWPSNKEFGEIDLLLEFERVVIGIEVKYHSGLSSDDQLERYSKMLKQEYPNKKKILLFLAKEPEVFHIAREHKFNIPDVMFGSISWQDILAYFEKQQVENPKLPEEIIINDIVDYLKVKGFNTFRNWSTYKEIDKYNKIKFSRFHTWGEYKEVKFNYKWLK